MISNIGNKDQKVPKPRQYFNQNDSPLKDLLSQNPVAKNCDSQVSF